MDLNCGMSSVILMCELAKLRGEESPDYTVTNTDNGPANSGLFSRLRDAFK